MLHGALLKQQEPNQKKKVWRFRGGKTKAWRDNDLTSLALKVNPHCIMEPDFKLIFEGPESAFSGCRMATNEKIIADEWETKHNLMPGDIKVQKTLRDGTPYFEVFARKVRIIDCSKNRDWVE